MAHQGILISFQHVKGSETDTVNSLRRFKNENYMVETVKGNVKIDCNLIRSLRHCCKMSSVNLL